ncbi:uncharacterized protein LOC143133536 [Alosa pseudoharengus]|uniref:uncharacterized protein LOC143133536 n=1 Tax=Alosa pseudoharengus TaxID=34774 RepID=UPI003F8CE958
MFEGFSSSCICFLEMTLTMLLYRVLWLSILTGVCTGQKITSDRTEVFPEEGLNVTLSCSYSSAESLQWYVQYPRSAPQFLLLVLHATGKDPSPGKHPRLMGKLNQEKTQVFLQISSVQVSDSALYYCALRPTVTLNHRLPYKNLTDSEGFYLSVSSSSVKCGNENQLLGMISHQYCEAKTDFSCRSSSVFKGDYKWMGWSQEMYVCVKKVSRCLQSLCQCRPVMMVLRAFLLLCLLIGESVGDTITPSHSSVVVIEGETVTFSCNYSSSSVSNLQWYRQYPNSIPEFLYLIFEHGSPSGSVPRLTPSIKKEEKRVFLELSSAEASDSAVYYCALRPTVTGTQTLLYKNLSDKEALNAVV